MKRSKNIVKKIWMRAICVFMLACVITAGAGVNAEARRNDFENCTVEGIKDYPINDEGIYTQPDLVAKLGDTELIQDVDYVFKYTGKRSPGRYTGWISGIGNYEGDSYFYFNVNPNAPTATGVNSSDDMLIIAYTSDTTCHGFEAEVSTSKDFSKIAGTGSVSGIKSRAIRVGGLSGGTTYYVRVRSYYDDQLGTGKRFYSEWSNVKSAKTTGSAPSACKVKQADYIGTYNKTNSGTSEYQVVIESIKKGKVTFGIRYTFGREGSHIYSTDKISATVNGKKATFKWKDSWGNSGKGTLHFVKKHSIKLEMKQTKTASGNFGSLELKGKADFKYANSKHKYVEF